MRNPLAWASAAVKGPMKAAMVKDLERLKVAAEKA